MIHKLKSEKVSSIEEFANHIEKQIKNLKNTVGKCWLCNENTNSWMVILPTEEHKDLGYGLPEDANSARILFAPVCKTHDVQNKDTMNELMYQLKVKSSLMKN